jgi:hypothetical protein
MKYSHHEIKYTGKDLSGLQCMLNNLDTYYQYLNFPHLDMLLQSVIIIIIIIIIIIESIVPSRSIDCL